MSTTFQELHIGQLAIHPKNVRRDVGIVTDLANSITAQGIMQPLVVAPYTVEKPYGEVVQYVIIAGHRRHAAAQLANLEVLPCVIREDLDTEPKQLEAMLVENTQRTDLTPVEEASGMQTVLEFDGHNVATLAKALGRSQSHVRKRLLLNKLPEEAKVKLEDRTLNIEQALVLVDFAEDEDATERLLAAAANGRDWNYQTRMETRRREAPAKTEESKKALEEAGAKYVPEATMYTGGWNRIYENAANAITVEAHVAAGHHCTVDTWGDIQWFEKPAKTPKAPKPELTEEEKEAKRRDAALSAALEIAHAVRAEHIKTVIKSPPEGSAEEALYALLLSNVHGNTALWSEITGCPPNDEDGNAEIKAAIANYSAQQMALLLHCTEKSAENELLKLSGWDPGDYSYHYRAKKWLESLGTVYHYEFSSVEQEVIDHFQTAHDDRLAETADEDQEEEDYEDD